MTDRKSVISALRALEQAATKGPWEAKHRQCAPEANQMIPPRVRHMWRDDQGRTVCQCAAKEALRALEESA